MWKKLYISSYLDLHFSLSILFLSTNSSQSKALISLSSPPLRISTSFLRKVQSKFTTYINDAWFLLLFLKSSRNHMKNPTKNTWIWGLNNHLDNNHLGKLHVSSSPLHSVYGLASSLSVFNQHFMRRVSLRSRTHRFGFHPSSWIICLISHIYQNNVKYLSLFCFKLSLSRWQSWKDLQRMLSIRGLATFGSFFFIFYSH